MGGRVNGCLSKNYVGSSKTTILFVLFIYRHVEYINSANKELEMVKSMFIIFDDLVSPASKLGLNTSQSYLCTRLHLCTYYSFSSFFVGSYRNNPHQSTLGRHLPVSFVPAGIRRGVTILLAPSSIQSGGEWGCTPPSHPSITQRKRQHVEMRKRSVVYYRK